MSKIQKIDNFKVMPLRAFDTEETLIMEKIKIHETNEDKPVYIPMVSENAEMSELNFLKLDFKEEYNFNKSLTVLKNTLESDYVGLKGNKEMLLVPALAKHINTCTAKHLNAIATVLSGAFNSIADKCISLYAKKRIGVRESLIMDKASFETLLKENKINGEPYVKNIEGVYKFNEDMEILVIEGIEGVILCSLDNIYCLLNGNVIEVAPTTELVRVGKIMYNSQYFVGIETIFNDTIICIK